jgi:serine/threonine-protein kinase
VGTVTSIAPDDALRPGVLLAGRYRLVELIERHDVAEVWEAHDEVLTRAVAVKAMHRHLASDAATSERFRRNGVAAAKLAHPNVAATFDTGTDDGITFLVMELVRGRNLRSLLGERGCLPAAEAVAIAAQVARALDHAHRAGLTHRTMGVGNVLICDDGTWPGRVKVTDFGEGAEATTSTAADEVRAVGALLHEMLAGEAPGADTGPPRLRRRRAGIPKAVDSVVTRALGAEGPRFASTGELAEALEAIELGDDAEPMVRRDPTPPGGVPVLARQAKRSVVPLVLFVLAAAVGVALASALVQNGDGGDDPGGGGGGPVRVAAVSSFDPQGPDREEHDELADRVVDGQPGTEWHSERYRQAGFGTKAGVGLILRLDGTHRVRSLRVSSPNSDWAAEIYVAAGPAGTLQGWGAPVDRAQDLDGDREFDLGGREAGAVLLWITEPGAGNRARITEVVVTST